MVAVILLIGIVVAIRMNTVVKPAPEVVNEEQMDVVPTVDKSTSVGISSRPGSKEIQMKIFGIPRGTTSVEYELSYQTKEQGTQGVIGTVNKFDNDSLTKDITLGTCSSGRCVYHDLDGPMNVTVKFYGDYGEKMYENKFNL